MTRVKTAKLAQNSTFALLTCGAVLCLVRPAPAFAQGANSATGAAGADERKAQAKAKYEQGVELYRNERYADAVQLFLEADGLSPSAALSFNIARAYEKLADDAATLRWYRNYLRLTPEAPNAAQVRQSIQTLSLALSKKGVQQLTLLSTPTGATVAIDGQALGVTPLTLELKPGAHHLLVTLRGFADAQRDFALSAPAPMDLLVALEPTPVPAPLGAAAAPKDRGRRFGVAPYVTLGAGVLALSGAALFEVSRRSAQNAARDDRTQLAKQEDLNAMNSRQTTARVLVGFGAVLAATGTTLLVLNTRLAPESSVAVSALPGGTTLFFRRRF